MRTYWENVAETRWGKYTSEIESEIILEGSKLAGEPGTALEVGCEGGRWSKMLADQGWNLICTDVNSDSLDVCKQKIPDALCIEVKPDDETLPVAEKTADLLLCIEVAPVIQKDWFIDEAYRVMKPNSIAVIMVWNKLSLRGIFIKVKRIFNFNNKHKEEFYVRGYSEWSKKLKGTGFEIIKATGFCWFPFSRASDSILVPFFVALEKYFGLRKMIPLAPWIILIARKC